MVRSTNSYRTPYARVRGRGGMSGTRTFWVQRVTSVLAIPLTLAFIIVVLAVIGEDYQSTVQILGSPVVAITMLLFLIVGIYHMWIGLQEILTDYVHHEVVLLALLMGNSLFCLVIGFATCFAVLKLAFGM
jgi:succinate dehydrogenase / fumarate reductase, membrane anchor subunit